MTWWKRWGSSSTTRSAWGRRKACRKRLSDDLRVTLGRPLRNTFAVNSACQLAPIGPAAVEGTMMFVALNTAIGPVTVELAMVPVAVDVAIGPAAVELAMVSVAVDVAVDRVAVE